MTLDLAMIYWIRYPHRQKEKKIDLAYYIKFQKPSCALKDINKREKLICTLKCMIIKMYIMGKTFENHISNS